jgi:hypothetical protein
MKKVCSARLPRIDLATGQGLIIDSRYRRLPIVALPFLALIALAGQTNPQSPVLDPGVQMKVLSTGSQTHPPVIVRHLFQMYDSASRDNFVKGGPSIRQLALRPNLQ